jgi:large subunit ribosomal protein L19
VQNVILDKINKEQQKKRPQFSVGDKVSVQVRLKEGDKERIQAFRGIVISKQPKSGLGPSATFTVRKISEGIGVERIFPVHSPSIEKIEIESSSQVRRSRLYYLRGLKGKKARLKEAERFGDVVLPTEQVAAPVATAEAAAPSAEANATTAPATSESDKTPKGA